MDLLTALWIQQANIYSTEFITSELSTRHCQDPQDPRKRKSHRGKSVRPQEHITHGFQIGKQ